MDLREKEFLLTVKMQSEDVLSEDNQEIYFRISHETMRLLVDVHEKNVNLALTDLAGDTRSINMKNTHLFIDLEGKIIILTILKIS